MKKRLAVLCLVVLALTACGAKDQKTGDSKKNENPVESTTDSSGTKSDEDVDDLEEYVGYYSNGNDDVIIEKDGETYTMSIGIYRIATLEGGNVSASEEGVVFETTDMSGDPIKFTFYQDGNNTYALRVDESTWEYIEKGAVYDGLEKDRQEEMFSQKRSDLEDGNYATVLSKKPNPDMGVYATLVEFEDDLMTVDASFRHIFSEDLSDYTVLGKEAYIFVVNSDTQYLTGGGTEEPAYMSKEEFIDYVNDLMNSGLGLHITIEDGIATEVGIWS